MGLFTRNKGQPAQQAQAAPVPAPAPQQRNPSAAGLQRPDVSQLSQSQYQQQLFHQHYQSLQPQQHSPHAPSQEQQAAYQQQYLQVGHAQAHLHQQQQAHQQLHAPGAPPGAPFLGPPGYNYASANGQSAQYGVQYGQHLHAQQAYTAVPVAVDPRAASPPHAFGTAPAGGAGAQVRGGGQSTALLYEAAQHAAATGKPLTLDFVGQLQPLSDNRQYGIPMPHEHPLGPPPPPPALTASSAAVAAPSPPAALQTGWQPGAGQNPYESIRIPALPDMRQLPPELQDFRDQCATGVRQAVAMISAMEHQLWWERSRRQQAEEDCKVLLAAVHTERGLAEALADAEERRRREAAEAGGKLTLAAEELPQATEAATVIQKHVRGRLARKEFESHLRDILRGVDPALDPAGLPPAAASHVSHVNTTGAPRRLGLRQLLGDVADRAGSPGSGASPSRGGDATEATAYYRRQVERIGQRLAGHKDAGEPHPGDTSGDPLHADVKQLLSGTYPASSAQVIAALVRRCRELQAALLEAVGELEAAQLSVQGLKDANAKLTELSEVRADLEATRTENLRLAGAVAKLRAALAAQAAGANAGGAAENPWVAAWYRKAYAEREWQRVPPGGPGGAALLDGPDSAVETWDDLRASLPEPVLVPRVAAPGSQYRDLLQLKQDMLQAARQGPPDPLYSMPVPDRSAFLYERDTPLLPTQSTAPLIRESLPPDAFMGLHEDLSRHSPRPSAPGQAPGASPRPSASPQGHFLPSSAVRPHTSRHSPNYSPRQQTQSPQGSEGSPGEAGAYQRLVEQQERMRRQAEWEAQHGAAAAAGPAPRGRGRGPAFQYNQDTPVVPVYSVLPLIREDEYVRRSMSPGHDASPPRTPPPPQSPPPGTPQSRTAAAPVHTSAGAADPYTSPQYSQGQGYYPPPSPQSPHLHPSVAALGAATMAPPMGAQHSPRSVAAGSGAAGGMSPSRPSTGPSPAGSNAGVGVGAGAGAGYVVDRPSAALVGAMGAGGQPMPRGGYQ